ncbi:MAG: hypothetical protein Q8P37_00250, partial [Candidatus Spechtbacteria bacterium]|nr:hypothetical protein [Candidatus Spechtbacteria bacterium]
MPQSRLKLKAWHLMPLSLIALIIAAAFIWIGRSDFSTRDVELTIEGQGQIENGKAEEFKLVLKNNSTRAIQNLNITLEVPGTITVTEGMEQIREAIGTVAAGETKEFPFAIVASSGNEKEQINARVDYSPEGISARFVDTASFEIIIGKLDVSIIFDLPQTIYSDQEIKGSIIIVPHSDIETSPLYLRLDAPEGFRIQEVSSPFDYETVWRI